MSISRPDSTYDRVPSRKFLMAMTAAGGLAIAAPTLDIAHNGFPIFQPQEHRLVMPDYSKVEQADELISGFRVRVDELAATRRLKEISDYFDEDALVQAYQARDRYETEFIDNMKVYAAKSAELNSLGTVGREFTDLFSYVIGGLNTMVAGLGFYVRRGRRYYQPAPMTPQA